jgi:Lon protease-like protein
MIAWGRSLRYLLIISSVWILLLHEATLVVAFSPVNQRTNPNPKSSEYSCTSCFGSSKSSSSSSYNPNEFESPEERQARMEMVRQIQAVFYRNEQTVEQQQREDANIKDPSIIHNLPLWRVQWTELPGYQNVLNVHVPHYTHMFRTLLSQPQQQPIYFGHVYLPGGSEQLGKPEFNLPENYNVPLSNDNNNNNNNNNNNATLVGTLMKITDWFDHPTDGRLTLVVQGVAPIKILEASQQVPYAIASRVKILSDEEPVEVAFHNLKKLYSSPKDDTDDDGGAFDAETSESVLRGAIQAMIAKQGEVLRSLEYRSTTLSWSNTVSVEGTSAGENVMKMDVSPLSNVNGSVTLSFPDIVETCQETFWDHWAAAAASGDTNDETLPLVGEKPNGSAAFLGSATDFALVLQKEQHVWIQLDRMLQLLSQAQPGLSIPVPSQLLGLLPTNAVVDWPPGFRLEDYAQRLEESNTQVGTYSQSPFVRLSKAYPDYPAHRRASRLSYSVWLLLESIAIGEQGILNRQKLLELPSIVDRLQLAIQHLKTINDVILMILKQAGR